MKYYEVNFSIKCQPEVIGDVCDVLSAMVGDAGFETFCQTGGGLCGYVQQQLFSRESVDEAIAAMPFPGVEISYTIEEAEDRDWNEQWEQGGFEPVVVECGASGKGGEARPAILIHDGRHTTPSLNLPPSAITVEIDARMAFGTGTHETTRMICRLLSAVGVGGKTVLDCGCGTGILSIVALKMGAERAVAYDIDEWSVDNTRHNAVINRVDDRISIAHGDASILNKVEERFGIVMANINRNILLADMPQMKRVMAAGGVLLLSGFYTDDVGLLSERGAELGLEVVTVDSDNGWAAMMLTAR